MWNYDMSKAPRGAVEVRTQKRAKGREIEREVFVPEKIIAAARDGKTVTVTYWIPDQQRWCMFSKNETPLCWMPWPRHPGEA